MINNIRLYISPFFLTRFYQLQGLNKIIQKYSIEGTLIDIGCGSKPYKYLFKGINQYDGIDFKSFSQNKDFEREEPEFYFNKLYIKNFTLPFADDSYENSIALQVLEHHKEPEKLISEMVRITKNGGYILISAPFLGGIHEEPNDFQRYTKFGLKYLFEKNNCKVVEINEQGSFFSTIMMLFNEYLNDFAAQSRNKYLIALLIYFPFLIGSYVSLLLDKFFISKKIVFNYLILAKK